MFEFFSSPLCIALAGVALIVWALPRWVRSQRERARTMSRRWAREVKREHLRAQHIRDYPRG